MVRRTSSSVEGAKGASMTQTHTPCQGPPEFLTLGQAAAILRQCGGRITYLDLYTRLFRRVHRPPISTYSVFVGRRRYDSPVPTTCIRRSDLPLLAAHLGVTLSAASTPAAAQPSEADGITDPPGSRPPSASPLPPSDNPPRSGVSPDNPQGPIAAAPMGSPEPMPAGRTESPNSPGWSPSAPPPSSTVRVGQPSLPVHAVAGGPDA